MLSLILSLALVLFLVLGLGVLVFILVVVVAVVVAAAAAAATAVAVAVPAAAATAAAAAAACTAAAAAASIGGTDGRAAGLAEPVRLPSRADVAGRGRGQGLVTWRGGATPGSTGFAGGGGAHVETAPRLSAIE